MKTWGCHNSTHKRPLNKIRSPRVLIQQYYRFVLMSVSSISSLTVIIFEFA